MGPDESVKSRLSSPEIDSLLRELSGLVRYEASRLAAKVFGVADQDDFYQVGMLAAWTALGRFDPSSGFSPSTFVTLRVRGAMIDLLRSLDHLPRTMRDSISKLKKLDMDCRGLLGRPATLAEKAEALGVSVEDVRKHLVFADSEVFSLDAGVEKGLDFETREDANPLSILIAYEQEALLEKALDKMTPRERDAVNYVVYQGLSFEETATIMGVSCSRITQLVQRGTARAQIAVRLMETSTMCPPSEEFPARLLSYLTKLYV